MRTEQSKKRILIYDAQANMTSSELSSMMRPGVQRVVSDNTVLQPKSYQIEAILPSNLTTGPFGRRVNDLASLLSAFSNIFISDATDLMKTINGTIGWISSSLNVLSTIVNNASLLPTGADADYVNKNAIEAAWRGQRVVVFKDWTGYDYKFVRITQCDIHKDGKEDDVFRMLMTIEEAYVLSINPAINLLSNTPTGIDRTFAAAAASVENRLALAPLMALTGVTGPQVGGEIQPGSSYSLFSNL